MSTGNSGLPTRRAVLAAGGVVALGGLAGCAALDGVVGRVGGELVGATSASPAAFYDGSENVGGQGGDGGDGGDGDDRDRDRRAFHSGPATVRFVPPSLQAASQAIEIEGWSTSTVTKAQDYNSSRSNKPSTVWWPGPDDGDDADGSGDAGTLLRVLDLERALLVYADAAIAAVDDRARDEATASLDAFGDAITAVRAELERCDADRCRTVAEHADSRRQLAREAVDAVDAGEWDEARRSLQQARRVVQGDIDDIVRDLDSDGDGIPDVAAPLYDYLDGEPTVGERFTVCLPDAQVRGDGPALAEELTPQRVVEYFVGERDGDSCGERDGPVAVHRDLSCRNLLTSTLRMEGGTLRGIDKKDIRRGVAAFETSGGVIVTGASPAADVAEPMARISGDCCTTPKLCCDILDDWGEETSSGEGAVSDTVVVPVLATPPDCPSPLPALLYVCRIRHDDQLLFAGGWVLDDGALYEKCATLLTSDGPNVVAGVTRSDVEEGGVDLPSRGPPRKKPGRVTYGNVTLNTPYDPDDDALPEGAHAVCRDDGSVYCWGVQSRATLADHDTGGCPGRPAAEGDAPAWAVVTALDAPVLHLVDADEAGNDVKFKAGAELSKAVN